MKLLSPATSLADEAASAVSFVLLERWQARKGHWGIALLAALDLLADAGGGVALSRDGVEHAAEAGCAMVGTVRAGLALRTGERLWLWCCLDLCALEHVKPLAT